MTKPATILKSPDKRLRQISKHITKVDKKTQPVFDEIRATLIDRADGVGLAAIQIGHPYRVFGTYLPFVIDNFPKHQAKTINSVRFFINPKIIRTSTKKAFTKEKDGGFTMEGCLSQPGLYAAVPRYEEVELEFQEIDPQTGQLTPPRRETFHDFYARNVQHEVDHLNGVLFTDYILDLNLALYQGHSKTDRLEEIEDLSFIKAY